VLLKPGFVFTLSVRYHSPMLQRLFLYGFLVLIIVGGGFSLWKAQQEMQHPVKTEATAMPLASEEGMVGENVTFTVTEADHKKWELRVKKAVYYGDRSGATLTDVSGEFFTPNGEIVARFQAPKGDYKDETKAVVLTNGVSVTTVDGSGSGIMAPKVVWSSKSDKVVADGGVRVQLGRHATIRASRCEFNLDFSKVSLLGGVHSAVDF